MVVKSGFEVMLEKKSAKIKLHEIEDKINNLSNLVSNEDHDSRFDMAVVQFKMYLEKIKDESLQSLVKSLHNEDFGYDIYSGNNGQDNYIKRLKGIYGKYIKDVEEKESTFKSGSKELQKKTTRNFEQFLKDRNATKGSQNG